ncbi:potassium channel family protein [Fervidibacillus halotolerans]|uniref:Ion channel n=1 Tax=Fervidibacillus halotolerans TaxID=2980027 RepID=A0A9E8LY20_9BACI|nr:potassium channel protein [Fervidibacillus halotolerans]WAA11815.1 ion channel [Fervidibacillus halotolerans]
MRFPMIHRFERFPYIIRLMIIVTILLSLFGLIIHWIEPEQFPSLFDGIWWAIITSSTIGYGDYIPVTPWGRIVTIVLILAGVGFLSTYFAALATVVVRKQNKITKGTLKVKNKNHFIIIGWNERSKEIIHMIRTIFPDRAIVLVDSSLKKNPFPEDYHLYFLRGTPFSDEMFMKANLKEAKIVMITADASKNEINADMQTILTIVAVKGFSPNTYCIAEILTEDQIVNAKRAGADEIIPSNKITGSIMMQTIINRGVSSAFLDVLNTKKGMQIERLKNHPFTGYSVESTIRILLQERKTLIGIYQHGNHFISPSPNDFIQQDDHLLIINHGEGDCPL